MATAATVDSPKKPKKAAAKVDNAEAVGKVWAAYRVHHPRCGEKIPAADARLIETALKDWSPEQLCRVVDWAHRSDHKQALFLRDNGYTAVSNLMVGAKIGIRLELAEAEAGPVTRPHPTPDGVVFGRLEEPKKPKVTAMPPGYQKAEKASGIDDAANMWDYAQRLKASKQDKPEVTYG